MYYIQPYLMHHGIKGQRWGVRNFQYVNGSLTPKGKMRYYDSTGKKISKHRAKLIEGYRRKGMNQQAAEAQAQKRVRAEKIMIGASAVTVAAVAAYVAKKKLPEYVDRTLSKGSSLARITGTDEGKLHDAFYAARGKHDTKRYERLLGKTRIGQMGKAYQLKIDTTKDIKIASDRNARKVFQDLYKNNATFKQEVNLAGVKGTGKNDYEKFNQMIVALGREDKGLKSGGTFYRALKEKGYGAIRDINDLKKSGYNARDPLIVFDKSAANVKSIRELNINDLNKAYNIEQAKVTAENYMKTMKYYGAAGVVAGVGGSANYLAKTSPKNIKVQKDQR